MEDIQTESTVNVQKRHQENFPSWFANHVSLRIRLSLILPFICNTFV